MPIDYTKTLRYERKSYDKDSLIEIKKTGVLDELTGYIKEKAAADAAVELLKSFNYKMVVRTCRYLRMTWTVADSTGNQWEKTPDKKDIQEILCSGMEKVWETFLNLKQADAYYSGNTYSLTSSFNNLDIYFSACEADMYYQWNVKFNIEDVTRFTSSPLDKTSEDIKQKFLS